MHTMIQHGTPTHPHDPLWVKPRDVCIWFDVLMVGSEQLIFFEKNVYRIGFGLIKTMTILFGSHLQVKTETIPRNSLSRGGIKIKAQPRTRSTNASHPAADRQDSLLALPFLLSFVPLSNFWGGGRGVPARSQPAGWSRWGLTPLPSPPRGHSESPPPSPLCLVQRTARGAEGGVGSAPLRASLFRRLFRSRTPRRKISEFRLHLPPGTAARTPPPVAGEGWPWRTGRNRGRRTGGPCSCRWGRRTGRKAAASGSAGMAASSVCGSLGEMTPQKYIHLATSSICENFRGKMCPQKYLCLVTLFQIRNVFKKRKLNAIWGKIVKT